MTTSIHIVGNYPYTAGMAPYDDPNAEIWAIGTCAHTLPRWDRCIEIHDVDKLEEIYKDSETWMRGWEHLQHPHPGKIIYMYDRHPKVPASVPYPIDRMVKRFGKNLHWAGRKIDGVDHPPVKVRPAPFMASACYQLALAIDELKGKAKRKPCEIGVWGIDMSGDEEWAYQRPAVWHFIGYAMGCGIKVIVPEISDIMKCRALYGYENEGAGGVFAAKMAAHRGNLEKLAEEATGDEKEKFTGALNIIRFAERELA